MKKALAALLIMVLVSCDAFADPTLVATRTPVGEGLMGYTISCKADSPSYFVLTDVVFRASPGRTFKLHFGGAITDEATVALTGGDLDLVSYYYNEFAKVSPNNVVFSTNQITVNSIAMNGGLLATEIPALYIVADADFVWGGTISVAPEGGMGVSYRVESCLVPFPADPFPPENPAPAEPATMAFLGGAGLVLLRRRRRA